MKELLVFVTVGTDHHPFDRLVGWADSAHTHPLVAEVDAVLRGCGWVSDARSRVRDMGHVLHVESFVVPRGSAALTADVEAAAAAIRALDWKLDDVVIMPVSRIGDLPDPLADRA